MLICFSDLVINYTVGNTSYPFLNYQEEFEDAKLQSESVNRRRTDNTMAKTKKDKRTNNYLQNTTQKIVRVA
jgi:hypothetical protein